LPQRRALNNSRIREQLPIIKYFAENKAASNSILQIALRNAYKQKDVEMIEYFENKIRNDFI
jgi:GTP-binding protein EngB required for normal cell division